MLALSPPWKKRQKRRMPVVARSREDKMVKRCSTLGLRDERVRT